MDDDTEAAAGISLAQDVEQAEVDAVVQRISALGQVPLVFAANGTSPQTDRYRCHQGHSGDFSSTKGL